MRQSLLIGAVVSIGAMMVVACGSTDTNGGGDGPAGPSGSSGTSGKPDGGGGTLEAGGDPDGGPVSGATTLKTGTTALVGVTSDGYAAYLAVNAAGASLEVVPVGGGTPIVIVPTFAQTDGVQVKGAAVVHWTSVTAGVGTLGYWTKATGPKTAVATASATGMFFSNPDSTRIAFSVGATATATGVAVTTAALAANTPVLTGSNTLNLAASKGAGAVPAACPPYIGFVGNALFAAYCTGVSAATKAARLVTVPDGATPTPKRLDAATAAAAATVRPFWSANTAGDKIFVIGSAATATGRVILNAGTLTQVPLDADTQTGLMLADGSAVVYRVQNAAGTTKALRRATAEAVPVTTDLVATGAQSLLAISPDQQHALYNTLAATAAGLVDIQTLSTTPPAAPTAIVAAATAYLFGFSGDGATVLYQTDVDANGIGTLKSKPAAGGAEKQLATGMYDLAPLKGGAGVLIFDNPQAVAATQTTTVDIKWLDTAAGGTPKLLAGTIGTGDFAVSGSTLVFSTDAGLFSTVIP